MTAIGALSEIETEDLLGLLAPHGIPWTTAVQGALAVWLHRTSGEKLLRFAARSVEGHEGVCSIEAPGSCSLLPWLQSLECAQSTNEAVSVRLDCLDRQEDGRPASAQDPPLVVTAVLQPALQFERHVDAAHFDTALASQLPANLCTLLRAFIARPDLPIAEHSLLTPEERHRMLVEWNDTAAAYPRNLCIHELFEAQAQRSPEAPALRFEGRGWSYRELAQRSGWIARRLRALGVGPEVRVGIACERSLEVVAGFLGVLRAGGTYVPVDPEDPPERCSFVLEDSAVAVLLTQEALRDRFSVGSVPVLVLDTELKAIADFAADEEHGVPLQTGVQAEHLAYLLYTSGSTGKPKGAMNTHRAVVNRLLWMQDRYAIGAEDRVLQKTPFSFDVSGWELFWPLLSGACMVLARPGGHRDSAYLADAITRERITVAHFVPSMLSVFLEDPLAQRCTSLRQVLCSGEALSFDMQRRFFETLPAELDNLYGPTEAAIDVSYWRCEREARIGPVPIGRPVANTQLYVLDAELRPLPIGVPGELHIGGVQVGRGYWNRPELTQRSFVADPFSSDTSARLYKTGDLARFREDGVLEYLGRIDHQVKIRGVRIELGEIESVLHSVPGVRHAVAAVHDFGGGDRRLIAYLVLEQHSAANSQSVIDAARGLAERQLSSAMVPAAFEVLDALPLGPTGKLDRKALPRPAPKKHNARADPARDLRSFLSNLWCEILGRDHVGPQQRFFDLGGNSLQAAQLINRVQKRLGEQIFVVALFEAPTLQTFHDFLVARYPLAVARSFDSPPNSSRPAAPSATRDARAPIDEASLEAFQRSLRSHAPPPSQSPTPRNPPAIFLLSTHRSGTTLLRVMLAGHPQIFAASELQLLGYVSMGERGRALQGAHALWREGTIRTVMEIESCDAETAKRWIQRYEEDDTSIPEFFRVLQEKVAPRLLLDKSPSNALDPGSLRQAEDIFTDAIYLHLVRHPAAMVHSAKEFHMDQIWSLEQPAWSGPELAEMVWTLSHRNIANFLRTVPEHRQARIRFEELVREPRATMEAMCARVGLPFHAALLDPYQEQERKMLNGIHPESMPMGDTKFQQHGRIDATVADRWREKQKELPLSAITWELAERLGYSRMSADAPELSTATPTRERSLDRLRALRQRHRRPGEG